MQGSAEFRVSEEVASEGLLAAGLANGTDGLAKQSRGTTLFDTGSASLREAAAARVAAHRSRRAGAQAMDAARDEALRQEQASVARESRRGVAKVRDAVRARYEQTQSYRDFLAVEAERAVQQARAEAEIAARNAKAIADAQMQLLEELRTGELREQDSVFQPMPQPSLVMFEQPRVEAVTASWDDAAAVSFVEDRAPEFVCGTADLFAEPEAPVKEISTGGLTVRLYDDAAPVHFARPELPARRSHSPLLESEEIDELEELEQEIAFRRAPEFEDHIIETLPLPANLIEFPRELIAARKARPRLAEGPLREELKPEPQLRIFEVESEQISIAPAAPEEVAAGAPVWQGLMLDAAPMRAPRHHVAAASLVDVAPISRRLMSAVVDACCVGVAMIGFWTIAAWISGPRLTAMTRPMLAIAVVFTLAIAAMIYQALFFCLNDATPGMRYARIALCTFAEASPTRGAMRRRLLAMLLALCPLGLGLLWAWMDDDRLAWHDRISRIYQRAY
jgi:hypothetical protein